MDNSGQRRDMASRPRGRFTSLPSTPGQAVVFYSRNTVLGGATIEKAL
jgi:hypothetical protein